MKKIIFFFILFVSNFLFYDTVFVFAQSKYITYNYAQITNDNVYLYKTNLSTLPTNAYFEIPKSYFVILISNIDNTFYKAQYKDVIGFVLKQDVNPIKEQPSQPFLDNITFRVYTTDGQNMLSSPFSSLSQLTVCTIPKLSNITYYGKLPGDELIENRSNIWYFGKYTQNNQDYKGYLYSGYCDNLSTISLNTEQTTQIGNPFEVQDDSYLYNLINMSTFTKIVIIFCVCAPCIVIIFLLFKPFKLQKQSSATINSKQKYNKTKISKNQTLNKIQKVIDDDKL